MTTTMNDLTFGIEIETVGLEKIEIAKAINRVVGGYLDNGRNFVIDDQQRVWKVVRDGSLNGSVNGEVVSPILRYRDMETLQNVIREIRQAGARVDYSCGIHIHIGADNISPEAAIRLAKTVNKYEDIIFEALNVKSNRRERYCQSVNRGFLNRAASKKITSNDQLNEAWYGYYNTEIRHYDPTRYHGLNLHSWFDHRTVEFRYFNGSLHAGKIKAYVQFCMALAIKAIDSKSASSKKVVSDNHKYTFRCFLLKLGLIGDEFKTARLHLMAKLEGDAAYSNLRRAA
jgi:hypothetical protein